MSAEDAGNPRHGVRRVLFWLAVAVAVALFVVLARLDAPLKTSEAPYGIVSLELASSVAEVETILASWRRVVVEGVGGLTLARRSIGIDFAFIVAYVTVLAGACRWAAAALRRQGRPGASAVRAVAGLQPVAGLLDVVENVGMLIEVGRASGGGLAAFVPPVVAVAASLKFLSIAAGVVAILWGLAARWLPRRSPKASDRPAER